MVDIANTTISCLEHIHVINSKRLKGKISFFIFREMKKDDCREKEDEGGGGLLANPDLALQVFSFQEFTSKF